jgi:hypothetical protein
MMVENFFGAGLAEQHGEVSRAVGFNDELITMGKYIRMLHFLSILLDYFF